MLQSIVSKHNLDDDGNPAGGASTGIGIDIRWQDGPLGRGDDRKEPNGAFVEGVIDAALSRLNWYQTANDGKFACPANARAIRHLDVALLELEGRTNEREKRGVEGTHTP